MLDGGPGHHFAFEDDLGAVDGVSLRLGDADGRRLGGGDHDGKSCSGEAGERAHDVSLTDSSAPWPFDGYQLLWPAGILAKESEGRGSGRRRGHVADSSPIGWLNGCASALG